MLGALGRPLASSGLRYLYACSFLLMGSFVALYNYIGFDLMAPPYGLSATLVSWIFLIYLVGTFSSSWLGRLADRNGRGIMRVSVAIMLVGAIVTVVPLLALKLAGVVLFTFGFFGSHSIASSWVGIQAGRDAAQRQPSTFCSTISARASPAPSAAFSTSTLAGPGVVGLLVSCITLALVAVTLLSRTVSVSVAQLIPSPRGRGRG